MLYLTRTHFILLYDYVLIELLSYWSVGWLWCQLPEPSGFYTKNPTLRLLGTARLLASRQPWGPHATTSQCSQAPSGESWKRIFLLVAPPGSTTASAAAWTADPECTHAQRWLGLSNKNPPIHTPLYWIHNLWRSLWRCYHKAPHCNQPIFLLMAN